MDELKYFNVRRHKQAAVLEMVDPARLEYLMLSGLRDELVEFYNSQQPELLVIDFSHVSICTSIAIAGLLAARDLITSAGGKLRLCGMNQDVRQVFTVTKLDESVFDIRESVADALNED